jgi:phage terminase large subunit
LDHYAKVLAAKPYVYGKHIAPHDIAVKEFGSGMTRIEKAKQLGIKFTVADNISIMDGIESVRSALNKVWIDSKNCQQLIKSLENYRQEFDAKKRVYKTVPLHDIHSHFADSMRYLCVTLPKTRDGLSPQELDNRYAEAMLGTNARLPGLFRDDQGYY